MSDNQTNHTNTYPNYNSLMEQHMDWLQQKCLMNKLANIDWPKKRVIHEFSYQPVSVSRTVSATHRYIRIRCYPTDHGLRSGEKGENNVLHFPLSSKVTRYFMRKTDLCEQVEGELHKHQPHQGWPQANGSNDTGQDSCRSTSWR